MTGLFNLDWSNSFIKSTWTLPGVSKNLNKFSPKALDANLISLKGDVIIKRDRGELTGEKGYMNLKTRKSKIVSSKSKRVKGIFSPIQK